MKLKELLQVKRRILTVGERKLAFAVFGDCLDLDSIELVAHRLILKGYAMSPNGNIYFHPDDWVEDFIDTDIVQQSWLVHELVHVWQVQQGIRVVLRALLNRRYDYLIKYGKQFNTYGVEQQAQMVQDYFLLKMQGKSCIDLAQSIPFPCDVMCFSNVIE